MTTTIVEQPTEKRSGYKLGTLRKKNRHYRGELWDRLEILWEGGWEMERNAHLFIVQAPMEKPEYYEWRCKMTSYINFLARLVGYLTGSLFHESLVVTPEPKAKGELPPPPPDAPFYQAFGKDCDTRGTDFSQFVRAEMVTKALVYQRALVQVDLPQAKMMPDGSPPLTLEHENQLGNRRAYLVPIDVRAMTNWKKDAQGNFEWCVIHKRDEDTSDPFALDGTYWHEFKVWQRRGGVVGFTILRTPRIKNENELTDNTDLEVVQPFRPTSFARIPIIDFELPKALWAGNQAGPLCQEHFRRRSDLMGSLCRNLVEIAYVKLGPQIPAVRGALPSDKAADQNRGDDIHGQLAAKGNLVLDAQDEVGYAGPTGAGHEIARAELKDTREEIFASLNAMALQLENSAAAVGRSGDSKAEDRSAMETLLTFLVDQTREAAQKVMAMVDEVRRDNVGAWVASGLSTFDSEDRDELVAEAGDLELVRIPSPTWKRLYMTKVALSTVPKASPEQKKAIEDELQRNITDEQVAMDPIEQAQRMSEAQGKFQAKGKGSDGKTEDATKKEA